MSPEFTFKSLNRVLSVANREAISKERGVFSVRLLLIRGTDRIPVESVVGQFINEFVCHQKLRRIWTNIARKPMKAKNDAI